MARQDDPLRDDSMCGGCEVSTRADEIQVLRGSQTGSEVLDGIRRLRLLEIQARNAAPCDWTDEGCHRCPSRMEISVKLVHIIRRVTSLTE